MQNHKRDIAISFLAALGSCIGFAVFLITPLIWDIRQAQAELLAHKKDLAQLKQEEADIAAFLQVSKSYSSELQQLTELFLNPQVPIPFIEFLEEHSRLSNLSLTIDAGNPQRIKEDPWPSMTFSLAGQGVYSDVAVFLQKLELAPFLAEIQNTAIQSAKGGVRFTILLKVYTK